MSFSFYVGCYGNAMQNTLCAFSLAENGKIMPLFQKSGVADCSYLLRRFNTLYAVSEGKRSAVCVYDISGDDIKMIQKIDWDKAGACHLMFAENAMRLFVSCYDAGCLAVFAVKENGTLCETPDIISMSECNKLSARQEVPHAHCTAMTSSPYRMASVNLGGDVVTVHNITPINENTVLRECSRFTLPLGSGPRHLVFSRMELAYLVCELSNQIYKLDFHAGSGSLWALNTADTLPPDYTGESTAAAVKLSPDERFLAVSNRGHNSVMLYEIDSNGSLVNGVCHMVGACPRDLAFSPDGKYILVCCQEENVLESYAFSPDTNTLTLCERVPLPSPACVIF